MLIQVDSNLCAGCGLCLEVCPVNAIVLINQRAVIGMDTCTQCEACVDACPNGAITAVPIPFPATSNMALAVSQNGKYPVSTSTQFAPLESMHSNRSLAPVAGAALAFLRSDLAPRMLDLLITTLERKLARPEPRLLPPISTPSRNMTSRGRGARKQIRYRGGSTANGN
jgi:NAD-dependent dihydropyrimidine dehydrogenase PreA subunit